MKDGYVEVRLERYGTKARCGGGSVWTGIVVGTFLKGQVDWSWTGG